MSRTMYLTAVAVTVLLMFSRPSFAAETSEVSDDTSRFFVTGFSNSTVQVSAISVIGATLIGIAIALAIGGLLPLFTAGLGAASMGKRSIPDFDPFSSSSSSDGGFNIFHLLAMIDGLRGFNVADVDCQKKAVCEIHHEEASISGRDIGVLADKIFDVFNYITPIEEEEEGSKGSLLKEFMEAAKHGKQKQDCERIYSSCEYSMRKVIRSLND